MFQFLQRTLLNCLVNGVRPREKYPATVRQFALTLSYFSPRAYEFVRHIFSNNLPNKSTIRAWYANSDLESHPGINATSIKVLKRMVENKKSTGENLFISICFDEMSIRQHFQWCHSSKIMLGMTTFGDQIVAEDGNLAKQVIAFMVNGVNHHIRIPVAFHFITSLNGNQRMVLLKQVVDELIGIGANILNIVFDGYRANATMASRLGANLDVNSRNFRPYFYAPNGQRIFIMYDNCHMVKLVRNNIALKQILFDDKNGKIEWSYFENLVGIGKTEGFQSTHKMNRKHMDFRRNKIKVDLAVLTLSRSTAASMEYLLDQGHDKFKDAFATIKFARTFNDLFDTFNTKSCGKENIFQNALNSNNANEIFSFFEEAKLYIKGLKFEDESRMINVTKSRVKTGFNGFIINMHCLQMMYQDYLENSDLLIKIPTYNLGQDPLEIFFGKVRALNGFNDNPTAQQFSAAFRKLLANDSITSSKHGNCNTFQSAFNPISDILSISSRSTIAADTNAKNISISSTDLDNLFRKLSEIESLGRNGLIDGGLSDCTVAQIARAIENRIQSTDRLYCTECSGVFQREEKIESFVVMPEAGKPSLSTFRICKATDRFLKMQLLKENKNYNIIHHAILNSISPENLYINTDFTHCIEHKTYFNKSATFDIHTNVNLRPQLHKFVHFYGM